MSGINVFISYSHDDDEHSQRVLELATALCHGGVNVELDRYHVRPPQGWPAWCEEQLRSENADYVLVICTGKYRDRVENRTKADEGRGVYWEGQILYSYLYDQKSNERFIPVLLAGTSEDDIPRPLKGSTHYRVGEFELSDSGYEFLYRELTAQPAVVKPDVGKVVDLSVQTPGQSLTIHEAVEARPVRSTFSEHPKISGLVDVDRIIKYAPVELIGREEETKLLEKSWAQAKRETKKRPHVLTFVALGGEGKTSLVADWVKAMDSKDWSGGEGVFAWSFYSQGSREQVAVSSDLFLAEALRFFGDPEMADSAQGAYDKGRRLAELAGERKSVLVLDGLEPLQYPPNSPTPGKLKDQGVEALLSGLARHSQGLCG